MAGKPGMTEEEARVLLETSGIVTLTHVEGLPSIVEAVAGGPVAGSWWSHPLGQTMFRLSSYLDDRPDVLTLKLVEGKVTFVARRLWPALHRMANDATRVTKARAALSADTKKFLARVEAEGSVVLAQSKDLPRERVAKMKQEIERSLLAIVGQRHTESGRHETIVESWSSRIPPPIQELADAHNLDDARRELMAVCGGRDPFAEAKTKTSARASSTKGRKRSA